MLHTHATIAARAALISMILFATNATCKQQTHSPPSPETIHSALPALEQKLTTLVGNPKIAMQVCTDLEALSPAISPLLTLAAQHPELEQPLVTLFHSLLTNPSGAPAQEAHEKALNAFTQFFATQAATSKQILFQQEEAHRCLHTIYTYYNLTAAKRPAGLISPDALSMLKKVGIATGVVATLALTTWAGMKLHQKMKGKDTSDQRSYQHGGTSALQTRNPRETRAGAAPRAPRPDRPAPTAGPRGAGNTTTGTAPTGVGTLNPKPTTGSAVTDPARPVVPKTSSTPQVNPTRRRRSGPPTSGALVNPDEEGDDETGSAKSAAKGGSPTRSINRLATAAGTGGAGDDDDHGLSYESEADDSDDDQKDMWVPATAEVCRTLNFFNLKSTVKRPKIKSASPRFRSRKVATPGSAAATIPAELAKDAAPQAVDSPVAITPGPEDDAFKPEDWVMLNRSQPADDAPVACVDVATLNTLLGDSRCAGIKRIAFVNLINNIVIANLLQQCENDKKKQDLLNTRADQIVLLRHKNDRNLLKLASQTRTRANGDARCVSFSEYLAELGMVLDGKQGTNIKKVDRFIDVRNKMTTRAIAIIAKKMTGETELLEQFKELATLK